MSNKGINVLHGSCTHATECPLSQVAAGDTVCIKGLVAAPEVSDRLREMGFCEEQKIKLVSRHSNYICQVCNARLGISHKLAETIIVEPLKGSS
ncbi:MAG: ferrous iron transport protein A [Verrucomicrobia bacterium]|jgi:Fe2+ transport system protein FeoA|nr:ferrous iron transport protein A [Verrucomicrobiota bacterium]